MRLFFTYSLLLVCAYLTTNGQTTTITLTTGSDWTDATLIKSLKSSESAMANTNYNSYPRLAVTAWNHSSSLATYRNLLKFDLTSIPVGTTVQSAQLQLFSDPANTSGEFSNSGSNSFYIQKVTQAWTASTVTWNNQPASTTTGRVTVGSSTSAIENITVNVTALVQDMVNNPASNYGLLLRLATETA